MNWPPKDWRALAALIFSVLGASILTAFIWWGTSQLLPGGGESAWSRGTEAQRLHTIRWILWICAGAIAVVLIGLGMAINRRSFRGKIGDASVDFEGGEEPAVTVTRSHPGDVAPSEATIIPEVKFGKEP